MPINSNAEQLAVQAHCRCMLTMVPRLVASQSRVVADNTTSVCPTLQCCVDATTALESVCNRCGLVKPYAAQARAQGVLARMRRSMVTESPNCAGWNASCPVFHSVTATRASSAPCNIVACARDSSLLACATFCAAVCAHTSDDSGRGHAGWRHDPVALLLLLLL
jgi:hypothetical protein